MGFFDYYPNGCRQRWANSCGRRCGGSRTAHQSDDENDYNFEVDLSSLLRDAFKAPKKCKNMKQTPRVSDEENKFVVKFSVNYFAAEDIAVKIVDRNLIINCKHNEKKDESNGWVTRDITRRFELPSDVDIDSVKSSLSSTNVLIVEFRKIVKQANQENVIIIPVIHEKSDEEANSEANADKFEVLDASDKDNEENKDLAEI